MQGLHASSLNGPNAKPAVRKPTCYPVLLSSGVSICNARQDAETSAASRGSCSDQQHMHVGQYVRSNMVDRARPWTSGQESVTSD